MLLLSVSILISKEYLGTSRHFLYDGESYTWSRSIPENTWVFGEKSSWNIENIAKHIGEDIEGFDKSPHAMAFNLICENKVKIPWVDSIPAQQFQNILRNLVDQLWIASKSKYMDYYRNNLVDNRMILESFQRPSVDITKIDKIASDKKSLKNKEILKFKPKSGDLAPLTRYSFLGSVTGRMTVVEGPNILTLKKSHRKIFKSRTKNGSIVQVDISSLEPRIALAICGKSAPEDVYSHVKNKVLSDEVSRADAKIAVLSCIYGSNAWSLAKRLPSNIDSHDVISKVKSYFNISPLSRSLSSELEDTGVIKNLYGRPIFSNSSLVNHYLQSSGVDVSFDVFREILTKMNDSKEEYFPIYVIHDAIVLDVSERALEKLKEITLEGIWVEKLKCSFPVKIESIKE